MIRVFIEIIAFIQISFHVIQLPRQAITGS